MGLFIRPNPFERTNTTMSSKRMKGRGEADMPSRSIHFAHGPAQQYVPRKLGQAHRLLGPRIPTCILIQQENKKKEKENVAQSDVSLAPTYGLLALSYPA